MSGDFPTAAVMWQLNAGSGKRACRFTYRYDMYDTIRMCDRELGNRGGTYGRDEMGLLD